MIRDASAPLQVLIVAGFPALRAGLGALLSQDGGIVSIEDRYASDLPGSPIETSEQELPGVIVADAGSLSDAAIESLSDRFPETPLVTIGGVSRLDESSMLETPGGFLPADVDGPALAAAVRAVSQGLTVISPGFFAGTEFRVSSPSAATGNDVLTPREREVLVLVADGLPNKAIARELGISEHTAKFHVGSVLGKLGASSRAEAVMLATRRGLLSV
jgi:two-component system nitrate/nitrite response regulator NarL